MIGLTKSIARSFGKKEFCIYHCLFVETDMAMESIEVYGKEYLTQGLALNNIAPQRCKPSLLLAKEQLIHATGQTFHINSGSYLI